MVNMWEADDISDTVIFVLAQRLRKAR